jgi:hypothetical protein
MAREIPQVVRAVAGLAATVLDEARKLPGTLPGLPVRVIGLAMQKAMWLQQQYSGLVARGDELFTGIRGDNEPGLATFDDDEPLPELSADGGGFRESAFDRAADTTQEAGADYLVEEIAVEDVPVEVVIDEELPDEVLVDLDLGPSAALADEPAVGDVAAAQEVLEELAIEDLVDDEIVGLPADPSPAEVVAAVEDITAQVAEADLPAAEPEAPVTEAPAAGDTATGDAEALERALLEADAIEPAAEAAVAAVAAAELAQGAEVTESDVQPDLEPDVDTLIDVPTPDGSGVETAEATVTDEGVAAPVDGGESSVEGAVAVDESGSPVAAATGARTDADQGGGTQDGGTPDGGTPDGGTPDTSEPATPPVDGYDDWSIAQLRGRLRGYAPSTVRELLAYEEATRAREPYLRMLRNRLEKVGADSA